jgi:DNA-binding LacI/PurR family transcriptional regulator
LAPSYTEGFQAAKILISQFNQKPLETNQILLPPELIVRNSTGPVRSGGI